MDDALALDFLQLVFDALEAFNEKHDCFEDLSMDNDNTSGSIILDHEGVTLTISTSHMEEL